MANFIFSQPRAFIFSFLTEYGPLTAGFERWANLPPAQHDLQSFGHAAVAADGTLEIKLMGIDGRVMYEKTLTPPGEMEKKDDGSSAPATATQAFMLVATTIVALMAFSL